MQKTHVFSTQLSSTIFTCQGVPRNPCFLSSGGLLLGVCSMFSGFADFFLPFPGIWLAASLDAVGALYFALKTMMMMPLTMMMVMMVPLTMMMVMMMPLTTMMMMSKFWTLQEQCVAVIHIQSHSWSCQRSSSSPKKRSGLITTLSDRSQFNCPQQIYAYVVPGYILHWIYIQSVLRYSDKFIAKLIIILQYLQESHYEVTNFSLSFRLENDLCQILTSTCLH